MRIRLLSQAFLTLVVLFRPLAVSAEVDSETEAIKVTASFPDDNPFGQIVNGEKNRINLLIENDSEFNVTLLTVSGAFHDADTDVFLKNASTVQYGLRVIEGTKLQIPYQFHSEYKPGDIRLNIWLTHAMNDKVYQVEAFNSVVSVVEPDVSIFDYKVVTTYLFSGVILTGLGYLAYLSFAPKPKRSRKNTGSSASKQDISSPVGKVTASGVGGYEEEWIPEHHLKKTKSGKKKDNALSSGDELTGGETSGTEGRKRKGRK